MRPLALELAAFGPYLTRQRIDFEKLGEHGLFLIHGRTGSGKSSVLDALCFALFGKSTGDERRGEDFVTTLDRGSETKVVLDFEHLGVRYRVMRTPTQSVAKKRGAGYTTRQTDASLVALASGEVIAAKAGDVTAAIEAMLHCDVSQFRQTVVLPQGDFRRVVTEHKARRDILASIFRTERFAALAERLSEAAKGLAREGQELREQRAQLLAEHAAQNVADLERSVSGAAALADQALTGKRQATDAKDAAVAAEAAGEALAEDFKDLHEQQQRRGELAERNDDIDAKRPLAARADKASRLLGLADELDRRRQERAELEAELSNAREAAQRARTDFDAAAAEREALEVQRPQLDEAARVHQRLDTLKERVAGLAAKRAEEARLREALAAEEARLTTARTVLAELAERQRQLEHGQGAAREVTQGEAAAREALTRARDDIEQAERIGELRVTIAGLELELLEHQGVDDPDALLTEAVAAGAPGLLARDLEDGQPCPVCGSVHHPSPSLQGDVAALRRAFEEFGGASAERAGMAERKRGLEEDLRARLQAQDWVDDPPPAAALEASLAAAAEGHAAVEAAKERLLEIGEQLDALERQRTEADESLDAARDTVTTVRGELQRVAGVAEGALEGLAPEHHDPEAFATALADAAVRHGELRERFDEAAEAVTRAEQAQKAARTAVTGAEGRLATDTERLEGLEAAFDDKLAAAGFSGRDDFDEATMSEDELAELQRELRGHDEALKRNADALDRLAKKLQGKQRPDVEALAAAVARAREVEAAAEAEWNRASGAHERVRQALERFHDLERKDATVAERRVAAQKLSELANGSLKGRAKVNFETFVLRSIFARVLVEGNRHLKHMTAGRYSLLLIDDPSGRDTGLELNVRDNASGGETRPVHTLSGGEGFLASLALALGLSEISQRESGGVELGALFIDEGFGSLDAQSLDHVIDILRGLEEGHRMVGIISHVEDLKRRIPVQLLVLDAGTGSRVEMRLNA